MTRREQAIDKLQCMVHCDSIFINDGDMEECVDLTVEGIMKAVNLLAFAGGLGERNLVAHLKMPYAQAYAEVARHPINNTLMTNNTLLRSVCQRLSELLTEKFRIQCHVSQIQYVDGLPNYGRKIQLIVRIVTCTQSLLPLPQIPTHA